MGKPKRFGRVLSYSNGILKVKFPNEFYSDYSPYKHRGLKLFTDTEIAEFCFSKLNSVGIKRRYVEAFELFLSHNNIKNGFRLIKKRNAAQKPVWAHRKWRRDCQKQITKLVKKAEKKKRPPTVYNRNGQAVLFVA